MKRAADIVREHFVIQPHELSRIVAMVEVAQRDALSSAALCAGCLEKLKMKKALKPAPKTARELIEWANRHAREIDAIERHDAANGGPPKSKPQTD